MLTKIIIIVKTTKHISITRSHGTPAPR